MRFMKVIVVTLFSCLAISYLANAGISVVSGLTYEKSLKAGETNHGVISIKNTGEGIQGIKVYQTDYLFFSDGRNVYNEPGKDPRSNAKWIVFSPSWMAIPPGEKTEINYTIKVPDDGSLIGTYWSMLMIEGIEKNSPEAETEDLKKDEIKASIKTVLRYGVQMITDIGDTGVTKLKFMAVKLLKEEGKRVLQMDIENIGEKWLRPLFWVEFYDEKGNYIGKYDGGKLRTYPGTSIRSKVDLSQIQDGKYRMLIIADCGGDNLFGATFNLAIH